MATFTFPLVSAWFAVVSLSSSAPWSVSRAYRPMRSGSDAVGRERAQYAMPRSAMMAASVETMLAARAAGPRFFLSARS